MYAVVPNESYKNEKLRLILRIDCERIILAIFRFSLHA